VDERGDYASFFGYGRMSKARGTWAVVLFSEEKGAGIVRRKTWPWKGSGRNGMFDIYEFFGGKGKGGKLRINALGEVRGLLWGLIRQAFFK